MLPPMKEPGVAPGAHLDEEECLPFPIFMAELELLVGNSKSGKPDGVQLLELLQKLVATIPRTDKAILKQHQRQCEAMLYDVLAHGIGSAVRRLIYNCFSSMFSHGDSISIYTRVNALQTYLDSKEGMSRSTAEPIRVGLLDLLAHLHLHHGRMLGNSAPASIGIALRTVTKGGNQPSVRYASLRLAAAVVRGMSPMDRSAPTVQADAWSIVQRYAKDRTCDEVRAGCLKVLGALCAAGGDPLWREGAYGAEEALRICLVLTEDPQPDVRDAAFSALGELAAASRPAAKSEAVTGEKRPAKKSAAERVLSGCVRACLVAPLLDAAMHSKREACLGISKAWMAYIAAIRRQHQGNEQTTEILEVAWLLINAVNEAARMVAEARMYQTADPGGELGSGLAGSEMPPLQACALYVMRRGIMSALTEAAQRKLLERLANTLDRRLVTPAAVVALEALAALLEAVGEVTDETANTLEVLLQPYVVSNSAATRQQAAVAMAALAAAHPVAAARMLSGCLDTVASCAIQLAAPLSAASGPPASAPPSPKDPVVAAAGMGSVHGGGHNAQPGKGVAPVPSLRTTSAPIADGIPTVGAVVASVAASPRLVTPNGGIASSGARPTPAQRTVLDTCHGAALSAARLLLTTARAPLGCPAHLQRRALALAEDLVTGPGPEQGFSRAICREVGFLLLGTLCALGVPQSIRGPEQMAALWEPALGEAARKDLDERNLLPRPGVELDLALQLWWRAVALQALSAYIAAAQSSSIPPAGLASGTNRSRSTTMLSFISSASSSFSFKHADAGLSRIRSGPSGAAAAVVPGAGADHDWPEVVGHLAPLLEPLLELLDTQSYLLDPAKSRGGPGGVLAGAAAMFILSLLELHLRAPGGRISGSPSHTALLTKACLRPFRHGLTSAAADALTLSGLRGLLNADDAPLGPWPPATDPLEDALRSFTGGRGAPHLPPWLSSEVYTALLSGVGASAGITSSATAGGSGRAAAGLAAVDGADDTIVDSLFEGGVVNAMFSAAPGSSLGTGGSGTEAAGVLTSTSAGLTHATYPQSIGLEAALLTVQLVLLGRQTAASPLMQQLQVLEVILNAVQTSKTFARQSRDVAACRRLPLAVAAAVVALAGYGHAAMAARRSRGSLDPTDKVPEKLLQLAQALMPDEDAATPAAAGLSRATAETYAASAATGSENWALRIVRALANEVTASAAEGRDSQLRAVLALALGAAHRSRGGLAMQAAVASSTEALVAAASRPGCAAAAAWVLHGLYLVASSAGGAFVPRVKTSLQLGQELIVSSFDSPALRAACARLANASVAVLGPEFSLGSLPYVRAKSLVAASGGGQLIAAEDQDDGNLRHRGGSGADGGLGLVLFVQQIILFAPHAIPPAKHVSLLLSHLPSSQPDLRAASALTLRHLAERSGDALKPSEAAPMLFAALDRESDARIAGQLRATITTVLKASAGSAPSYWLELLSDVVFAAGPSPSSAASGGGAADVPSGGDDDDDGKGGGGASSSGGTGPKGSGRLGGSKNIRSVREVLTAPHLRTRHYAADCLLRLVRVCVTSDERHRDSSVLEWQTANRTASAGGASGHGGRRDLLIAKLQVLVDMGFKLATCPLESLRPHGVRMLTLLVKLFGDVPDPLLPGARLMEQYQAQVVSALRSSLGARQAAGGGLPGFSNHSSGGAAGPGAQNSIDTVQHPLLQIAGGVLATCFLESGLAAGDAVVMRRLMELLSSPLSAWRTLRYESYAEWVGARARVELLRAHAQCSSIAAAAAARGDALCAGIVTMAQEPHAARLQALWAMILQDHVVLCSQPEAVLAAYRSQLLDGSAPWEAEAATPTTAIAIAEGDDVSMAEDEGAGKGLQKESPVGGRTNPGFGFTPAVAAVLRPVYAAACPSVLAALAGRLLPPAELLADPAVRAQFQRLLEVGLMLLSDAAGRLAHAVHEATRGAAATAASASSQGGGASSLPPVHGTSLEAASAAFPQLRDAATRLASVLRALQRFLSPDYLTAFVGASPVVNGQGAVKINGHAAAAAAIAPTAAGEPLVPPAMLHDLLQYLGAAAFHAFMPLHKALLEEVLPPSLGTLLAGLVLLCSSLVREVCAAAPAQILSSRNNVGDDNSSLASTEDDDVSGHGDAAADPQPRQGPATGDGPGEREEGWMAQAARTVLGSSSERLQNSAEGRCGSISGSGTETVLSVAIETILLLASTCAPYSYGPQQLARAPLPDFVSRTASTSGCGTADSHAAISCMRPPYMGGPSILRADRIGHARSGDGSNTATIPFDGLVGCVPISPLAPEASSGLTQCVVQVLAAAQQLIRRASWSSLVPHVGSLLELPLRLILTSAPGTSFVVAAQRYLDTTTAALLARPEARPATNGIQTTVPAPAGAAGAGDCPSPAVLAGAVVVALADAAELHLRALQSLRSPDGGVDSNDAAAVLTTAGPNEDNDAVAVRLQGRLAALVSTLMTCTAGFEAAEPLVSLQPGSSPSTTPIPSPSKGGPLPTLGRVGSSSSGSNGGSSGFGALHLHQQPQQRGTRSSLSTGSGSSSRLGTSNKAGAVFAAPQPATLGTAPAASMPSNLCRLDQASVRECVLAVLMGAFQAAVPPAAALSVLDTARTAAQEAAGEDPGSPRGRWVRTLVCFLMPLAVERVALLLARTKPLTGVDQSLVAECLKLLVLAATLASPQGAVALDGVMQVLVPLLVEVAAPAAGPAAATPALRDMAVKLITSLPTTASGPAFKTQLAAQPAAAKLRLQSALREAAASAAATTTATAVATPNGSTAVAASAGGAVATAGGVASGHVAQPQAGLTGLGASSGRTRPTIQLKTTFALPLPTK
ncbi:hypothetical protein Vafri_8312 [Volvox africanus]|nr:hypothetical protein Vafri_8312 [Volvox africanus]